MSTTCASLGKAICGSIVVSLLVIACATPAPAPAPAPAPEKAAAQPAAAKPAAPAPEKAAAQPAAPKAAAPAAPKAAEPPGVAVWPAGPERQRVLDLIEQAKKEGQVAWRATLVKDETARAMVDAFRKYYGLPDFKVAYDTDMFSGDLISKTNAEIGAGKLAVDIIATGTMAFVYDMLKRGEFMKYESPTHKAYGPAQRAGITEPGYWVADAYTFIPVWNTQLWPQGIKTWEDTLNPALKGKVTVLNIATSEISAANFLALKSILGKGYWEAFAKLQPVTSSRAEDAAVKAASGEYPVAHATMPSRVYQLAKKGAPLATVFPEKGLLTIPQPWVILAKAPHPNAAKLWIDFIFSAYGQEVYQKGEALFSGREGFVPAPDVAPYGPPIEKLKVIPFSWKEYTPEVSKAARDEAKAILEAGKQ